MFHIFSHLILINFSGFYGKISSTAGIYMF